MPATPGVFVGYSRGLTDERGRSGLGLEDILCSDDQLKRPSYVEVGSGRLVARPKLTETAGLIGERNKAAPAAVKAPGAKLGGDCGYRLAVPMGWRSGVKPALEVRSRRADHAAHRPMPASKAVRRELGGSTRTVIAVKWAASPVLGPKR